ncbi:nicotinamide-nucleotide amidohydrolase family protein [Pseudomonas veronii]|uniref:nicotinamide-nucleotide amidohydrolase family protein n=1 Tax=Pseudomonas veronii TaxID=76761 RepID=UPI001F0D3736|nr:nicotinamide-nucleotide amidohydrolase family protein [Pseudomonas veronii]
MKEITQLAAELGRRLQVLNAHVTTAESCTGGGIAEAITRIPGEFGVVRGGICHLFQPAENSAAGCAGGIVRQSGGGQPRGGRGHGQGRPGKSLARFAVAVSGVAGPDGGSPEKPVGTVWLAFGVGDEVTAERQHFPGNRDEVRRQTVKAALEGLLRRAAAEIENQG